MISDERARADAEWDRLASALAQLGIRYLPADADATPEITGQELLRELVSCGDPRLQDAAVALLLLQPELARVVETDAALDAEPRRRLAVTVVVAASLQREWKFSLDIYAPDRPWIDAPPLAIRLGLPDPAEDFGRAALHAAGDLLREEQEFPFNYEEGWEHAVKCLIRQRARELTRQNPASLGGGRDGP